MQSNNIPQVKLGIIAVSRDCFPIALSTKRRENIVKAYKGEIYDCQTTVENEQDMLKAIKEVREAGCNALVVFLGNFGPETPETLIAKKFHGPCMFVSAAEGDGDMINGRGDAYCGMLNCSYNLAMRHLKGYIPAYPVGTADDIAMSLGFGRESEFRLKSGVKYVLSEAANGGGHMYLPMAYLAERDTRISIPAKSTEIVALSITEKEGAVFGSIIMFVLPALVLAAGLIVYIRRRRRA